jgi:hypothetical protein
MIKIRSILAAAAAITLMTGVAACNGGSNGSSLSNQQQSRDTTQMEYVEPLPYFPYSQMRQTLIEIEAIQALGIASTTFDFIPGIDHPVLACPSIGVPIPGTDELSNPAVAQWRSGTEGNAGVTVGQEDPTGVFAGETTGTGGLCLDSSANQYLNDDEGYDVALTAPAYWDTHAGDGLPPGHIQLTGPVVMPKCHVRILSARKHKAEEICTK